jgi:hypothetical protein
MQSSEAQTNRAKMCAKQSFFVCSQLRYEFSQNKHYRQPPEKEDGKYQQKHFPGYQRQDGIVPCSERDGGPNVDERESYSDKRYQTKPLAQPRLLGD